MLPYPFPHYGSFVWGTPTIPNIYWNAYSYEERIKKLCMEYAKLICYLDELVDTVNKQYEDIESINDNLVDKIKEAIDSDHEVAAKIDAAVAEYINSKNKGTTYGEIKTNGFIY